MEENQNSDYLHTSVSGAINQHTPSYWRLVTPALSARYIARYVQKLTNSHTRWFDAAAGAWMFGVTGFFAKRTWQDIKSIFSEAVAYEFDKSAADINSGDLMRSENKALITARKNLVKYTGWRALANSTFFASFLPGPFRNSESVDLGVGLNGAYLVGEVLGRGRTFFEQVQSFTDSKLNQKKSLGENITPSDLLHLYERNALDNDPGNAFKGKTNTPLWKQSQVAFERMADLMNRTYQQKPNGETANFTLPKFLYLLGHNLIQPGKVEQTMAFIEVFNRYDITALKKVVNALKDGTGLDAALQPYPEILPEIAVMVSAPGGAEKEPAPKTIRKDEPHAAGRKYAEGLGAHGSHLRMEQPAAAYADKTAKTTALGLGTP